MFLSILQLISSFTLMVGNSGTFDNQSYMLTKYSLPPIIANINRDDLSVLSYDITFNPFGSDFIQDIYEEGMNILNPSYILLNHTTNAIGNPVPGLSTRAVFSFLPVEPSTTYTIIQNTHSTDMCIAEVNFSTDGVDCFQTTYLNLQYSYNTFTTTSNTYYVVLLCRHQNGNTNVGYDEIVDNLMVYKGNGYYDYQPYHTDSEIFDVPYDYSIYSFDLYDSVEGIYYPKFLDLRVSFSFASRVQYDSIENYYYFDVADFYFGIYKWDFDNDFPRYAYLNYFLYSNAKYNGNYITDSFYSQKKVPLIYGSADPYDSNYYSLDVDSYDLHCYSDDFIEFYVNFEYIDSATFDLLTQGMYGMNGTFIDGYNQGYKIGYDEGYNNGLYEGTKLESQEAYDNGYQQGFSDGMDEVIDTGQTASIIFNGIISVGLLPTNVFLKMLNLEVFGINIGALVSSLLTIMVIIIVVRMIFGGKNEV